MLFTTYLSYFVGYGGSTRLYKTIDGGVNWSQINTIKLDYISFPTKDVGYGYAPGFGKTYKTTDGVNWYPIDNRRFNYINFL